MTTFDAFVRGKHGDLVAGDKVEIEIVVQVPKTYRKIALDWQVGWTASGRTTDTVIVASGAEPIAVLEAGEEAHLTIPFTLPADGPISYRGQLFALEWFVKVSLDIPWAIDPKSLFSFEVGPRRVRKKKVAR